MKKLASLLLFAVMLVSFTSFSSSQQQPAAVAPHIYITVDNQTDIEQSQIQFISSSEVKVVADIWPYTTRYNTLYHSGNNQIEIYGSATTDGLPVTLYFDWYIGNASTPAYSFSYSQPTGFNFIIPQQGYYQTLRCVIHY